MTDRSATYPPETATADLWVAAIDSRSNSNLGLEAIYHSLAFHTASAHNYLSTVSRRAISGRSVVSPTIGLHHFMRQSFAPVYHAYQTPAIVQREFPRPTKSIAEEIVAFARAHEMEDVLRTLEGKASELFPGVSDVKMCLERDPDSDNWEYVRVDVTVDSSEDDALVALGRYDDWLVTVLPQEKLSLISIALNFKE